MGNSRRRLSDRPDSVSGAPFSGAPPRAPVPRHRSSDRPSWTPGRQDRAGRPARSAQWVPPDPLKSRFAKAASVAYLERVQVIGRQPVGPHPVVAPAPLGGNLCLRRDADTMSGSRTQTAATGSRRQPGRLLQAPGRAFYLGVREVLERRAPPRPISRREYGPLPPRSGAFLSPFEDLQ